MLVSFGTISCLCGYHGHLFCRQC